MTTKTGNLRTNSPDAFDLPPVSGADTSDIANHHHDHVPRAAHISLNDPFVDQLEQAGLTAYIAILAKAAKDAANGASGEAIQQRLRAGFDAAQIEVADAELAVIAEELVNAAGVLHISAYGTVVYGSHRLDVATFQPDVVGTEDPQSPNRPIFS